MLLSAEKLSIHYGIKDLVKDASLYLEPGDKIGVIGINGTGKSTLLRCLAGQEIPDSGIVTRYPNVQIIGSTHSPFILAGAPKTSAYSLDNGKVYTDLEHMGIVEIADCLFGIC